MKRQFLLSCLAAGAALTLLGGCASEYDSGYYGSAYYGNGYYGPDYDSSIYYGGTYYGPGYIPRGGYGGGYRRDWHGDRDRVRRDGDNRRGDGEHRDFRRGDNDGNRQPGTQKHNHLGEGGVYLTKSPAISACASLAWRRPTSDDLNRRTSMP